MPVCHSARFAAATIAILSVVTFGIRTSVAAETPVERGKYLMSSIVACGNCHTPKGPNGKAIAGKELSGNPIVSPIFQAIPGNITPDKETGIGNWTDDQIVD